MLQMSDNHLNLHSQNATGLDSCVVGKSNMYRKSTINALRGPSGREEPKGLKAFSPYLPEDNLIAHGIMHQLKLAHAMTPDLAMDCLGPMTLTQYVARRVRWIRVRKKMVLAATLIEPLTESILLGIVASWAAHLLVGIKPTWFFALHESAWTLMDLMVVAALRGEYLKGQELVDWLFVWTVREALALPVWLKAMLGGDRVVWRSTTYKILKNGAQ
jgi:ceramide glucosyltransferase